MTATKNVYALMLALVIVLSGCFGNTTNETDAQQSQQVSQNAPPVIFGSISVPGGYCPYENGSRMCEGMAVLSASDIDGNVTDLGVDFDFDGIIDTNFSGDFHSITRYDFTFSMMAKEVINRQGLDGCYGQVLIIAIDDSNESVIEPYQFPLDCN